MRLLIIIAVLYFAIKMIIAPFFQGLMAAGEKDKIKQSAEKKSAREEYIDYEEVE